MRIISVEFMYITYSTSLPTATCSRELFPLLREADTVVPYARDHISRRDICFVSVFCFVFGWRKSERGVGKSGQEHWARGWGRHDAWTMDDRWILPSSKSPYLSSSGRGGQAPPTFS